MPAIIDMRLGPTTFHSDKDYGYVYPKGLDFKPGSALHNKITTKIYQRARESSMEMRKRFATWKKIDRNLTAYIPLDDAERFVKESDDRKPVSIVVPYSYATLETLLTYQAAAFLENPIFRYEGVSPEDSIGAILLEKVIELQTIKAKMALNLHTTFRDGYAYGIGVAAPSWEKTWGKKTVVAQDGFLSSVFGKWIRTGQKKESEDTILYEGNVLKNVDPYLFLPDPSVPTHDVQKGEYVGWIESTNYLRLLDMERYDTDVFNVKHLQELTGASAFSLFNTEKADSGRYERFSGSSIYSVEGRPIDVIWMYVNLIPKEWELGDSEYPEKWLFGFAADRIIICAKPIGLNHNMYPIAVCAPDSDGYSVSPVSRMEIVYGLQETLDWLFSSHIANVRKSINDMLIVDPSLININDLKDPAPGKLLRMRRAAWGRGVDNAVKQLQVNDITQNHIKDSGYVADLIQKCTGSVDSVMGFQRKTSERVSATESRDTRSGALSRLAKTAKLVSLQMMQDLGYMLASHTQQLMSQELFVSMTGRWQDDLVKEYGDAKRVKVSPFDIIIDYDVTVKDGSLPSGEGSDLWIQLFQIISQQPLLMQQFDIPRIFMHIARGLGAKDVEEFKMKQMPQTQPVALPDQQVEAEAQAGNLIPVNALNQIGGQ
jgi:hypothetical protein